MADRQRTTWQQSGGKAGSQPKLPVERSRAASAHPATPDEGPASPAYPGQDPGEHDYENGDTSAWGEDPTKGPYPQSAHPATPDEGPASPAYKQAAKDLRASVEARASKCLRIAQALLGPRASTASVEDQALNFMYMTDGGLSSTLKRLAGKKGEDEPDEDEPEDKSAKKAKKAEDDEDEDEGKSAKKAKKAEDDEDEESEDKSAKKKAKKAEDDEEPEESEDEDEESEDEDEEEEVASKKSKKKASAFDQILSKLGGIESRLNVLEGGKSGSPKAATEDEILASLLAEEGMPPMDAPMAEDDTEAMLAEMMNQEGMGATQAPMAQDPMDIEMGDGSDMFGENVLEEGESAMLAQLFASNGTMSVKAEEEGEEEEEEAKEAKHASKTASQKPRDKKASVGVARLGGVQKQAASAEIAELEKLWASAPDISNKF